MLRRAVITGMGLVTPLGMGVSRNWEHLTAGHSGIRKIESFDTEALPSKIAGLVPRGDEDGAFNPDLFITPKDQRKMDTFIHYGIAAATEAIRDSGWEPQTNEDKEMTGVMIGSGIGGLQSICENAIVLHEKGPRRISPFFIPASLINLASGNISIQYDFRGPNHSVVTACSTGAHAIGDAARLIGLGDCNVMVAGGTEAAVCPLGMAGFSAARALSTSYNDAPAQASRPFDEGRDGFVIAEGAGVVVVEELEHAKKRGATIYAEVIGYGLSGDAYHITSPPDDGRGAYKAMQAALKRAGMNPGDIDYVNAHGTSTPVGDRVELSTIRKLFGAAVDDVVISSTKSAIGHLLGAAGSVEAIYAILAMQNSVVPPTLNLETPMDVADGLNLAPGTAQEKSITAVMSNSFGFGGTNASLVLKRVS